MTHQIIRSIGRFPYAVVHVASGETVYFGSLKDCHRVIREIEALKEVFPKPVA